MIRGPKCPDCGSLDTEQLITIGSTTDNECLSCFSVWTRSTLQSDVGYVSPLDQFVNTGEDRGL